MNHLQVRDVTLDDSDLLLSWRNDAVVRQASRSTDVLSRGAYVSWLESRISSPDSCLYLVLDMQNEPLAQVRFDCVGTRAEVSIFLAPAIRGQGRGLVILRAAQARFLESQHGMEFCAFVKSDNAASHSLFRRAGYRIESIDETGTWYVRDERGTGA